MILRSKIVFLLLTTGLAIAAGLTLADEPTETGVIPTLELISDTKLTTIATALADSDSALLVSAFRKDIQIAMPEGKTLMGRERVAHFSSLLFENFGGGNLTYERVVLELVKDHDDIVYDAGRFDLTRQTEDQTVTLWSGAYTIYWRLIDSTWTMDRLFVGQERP